MKKTLLTIAGCVACAAMAPLGYANQLYADGSIGIADVDVGPYDTDDTYFRIGAGVTLTENISAEAGFWDFGSSRVRGARVAADALYGALRASAPVGNNLTLFGRLGLLRWDADVGTQDDDGHDLFFGGGIGLPVGPGQLSFEVNFSELDEVDLRTMGVSYSLPLEF
ncbi:outer membrane beta-barrel protein [Gilvimarinus sp. F26214L]|uniref:outer membrane beta-barrel protein n=1 Tax=Gilvimarinus sp. DZF01 TaxID=3461371 RepID=UPI0040456612